MLCIDYTRTYVRGRVGVLRYRRAGDAQLIAKTEGEVDSIDVAETAFCLRPVFLATIGYCPEWLCAET